MPSLYGIYYDDPENLKNPNKLRAVFGVCFDPLEVPSNLHRELRVCEGLPFSECLETSFPIVSRAIPGPLDALAAMKCYPELMD